MKIYFVIFLHSNFSFSFSSPFTLLFYNKIGFLIFHKIKLLNENNFSNLNIFTIEKMSKNFLMKLSKINFQIKYFI